MRRLRRHRLGPYPSKRLERPFSLSPRAWFPSPSSPASRVARAIALDLILPSVSSGRSPSPRVLASLPLLLAPPESTAHHERRRLEDHASPPLGAASAAAAGAAAGAGASRRARPRRRAAARRGGLPRRVRPRHRRLPAVGPSELAGVPGEGAGGRRGGGPGGGG